ncbi:pilin [Streptomyces dysideae]|uniref:Uncharacterized protein n=1 Tax=Streptomyces dysideae TaxID=909626 RepID=A0A101UYF5_9ACTN|nr:pilin [Streptomyces dysideae]KUO19153.1 hypothetical protein AQJ91_21695 [Streptomyces dysideae]
MFARPRRPRRPSAFRAGRWVVRLHFTAACTVFVLLADTPYVWAVADIPTVITNLRNWIVGILAGLGTLFLTLGGLRYLMAGGDPGEVEAAKRALKAASIGYSLAILAPVIMTVLQGIVGVDDGGGQ